MPHVMIPDGDILPSRPPPRPPARTPTEEAPCAEPDAARPHLDDRAGGVRRRRSPSPPAARCGAHGGAGRAHGGAGRAHGGAGPGGPQRERAPRTIIRACQQNNQYLEIEDELGWTFALDGPVNASVDSTGDEPAGDVSLAVTDDRGVTAPADLPRARPGGRPRRPPGVAPRARPL